MPNAALSFALPEERYDHLCAIHGPRLAATLRDVDDYLRGLLKHGGIASFTPTQLAEALRSRIAEDLALVEA